MASNGTAVGALPSLLSVLPNPSAAQIDAQLDRLGWYSVVDSLSATIGAGPAGVLLFYLIFKVWNLSWAILFDIAEYYGYLDEYIIQPDKPMPWEDRIASYKRRHGLGSWKGAVKVLLPSYVMNYYAMNLWYGAKTTDRWEWTGLQTVGNMALAFFIHDFILWAVHYTLHQIPWLYVNVHKTHHAVKNPRISVSGDLTITDYYLMDRGPPTIVAMILKMPFPVYILYQLIFYYTANRAHAGASIPWDPCNWLWPNYQRYHDFHHEATHASYQTWGWWWDWLVGADKAFYKDLEKKKAAKAARQAAKLKAK
ncbi:hypothetical protein DFJ74DRAFT_123400 [Hyaloraphidium curvatum]|nr:hypothetical protein DFJ74DRAFT_123400 [Hyaloraphidium curvatum]